MIISRTPFRISFFGGGTDYPAWYRMHGGAVIAATIDKYCYLTCRYLPPFFEHRFRVVYSKIEDCQTVDQIAHPVVREVLKYAGITRGAEVHHDGDLPARSGMGSSSAFTVGLLHALYALKGCVLSKQQLARESIHIEQDILRETVGSQDQILAAHGGLNHIVFQSDGEISVRPLTLARERIADLNSHLMLFYTGLKRTASNIAATYVNDIDSRRRELRIMKELVEESIQILSSQDDIGRFGDLLQENWKFKRSLSTQVSNPQVDGMYEAALAAGAIGGKLTGAGGGGFMLLFAPPNRQKKVKECLSNLIHVPFKFQSSGSQIIFYDPEIDYSDLEASNAEEPIRAFKELGDAL